MVPPIGEAIWNKVKHDCMLNPWLPPQLYAVSNCSIQPLGNWEGRAKMRRPASQETCRCQRYPAAERGVPAERKPVGGDAPICANARGHHVLGYFPYIETSNRLADRTSLSVSVLFHSVRRKTLSPAADSLTHTDRRSNVIHPRTPLFFCFFPTIGNLLNYSHLCCNTFVIARSERTSD